MARKICSRSVYFLFLVFISSNTFSAGVFRDGINAETSSRSGLAVVGTNSPLGAMSGNPASLGRLNKLGVELNISIASFDAEFTDANRDSHSSEISRGAIPAFAVAWKGSSEKLTFAISASPDIALQTRYRFTDPAGGLAGVSYGRQRHSTLFAAVSTRLGVSYQVNDSFLLGGSVGLLFIRNEMQAPYIFQDQAPAILPGFKAPLDLSVNGIGYTAQLGLLYQVLPRLEVGFSHRFRSNTSTEGSVFGNADAQLSQLGVTGFNPEIEYDVKIDTRIPSLTSLGIKLDTDNNISWMFQGQLVRNESAFRSLDLQLTGGQNQDLNALLGVSGFTEKTPLNWKDQYVFSMATDFPIN